jgi:hypothetical protein
MALGVLVGVLRQRGLVTTCLHRLGLRVNQPNPTAWDQFFIKTEPVFALVTLKDRVHFAGRFGPQSAASSDGHNRDIYLESVFTPGTPWTEIPGNAGVWIRGDEIKHIEFHREAVCDNPSLEGSNGKASRLGELPATGKEELPAGSREAASR